ncbi:MAG: hypothetical protein JKP92_05740 [Alphaproteobacteria bacterium]|nr:hypothetical protein [Alphaproteobacteria bacterium]
MDPDVSQNAMTMKDFLLPVWQYFIVAAASVVSFAVGRFSPWVEYGLERWFGIRKKQPLQYVINKMKARGIKLLSSSSDPGSGMADMLCLCLIESARSGEIRLFGRQITSEDRILGRKCLLTISQPLEYITNDDLKNLEFDIISFMVSCCDFKEEARTSPGIVCLQKNREDMYNDIHVSRGTMSLNLFLRKTFDFIREQKEK